MSIALGPPHCRARRSARQAGSSSTRRSRAIRSRPSAVGARPPAWLALRTGRSEAAAGTVPRHGRVLSAGRLTASARSSAICSARSGSSPSACSSLQEDPEDEATLNPKELGIFVHEVFQKFFEEWNRQGQSRHHAGESSAGARDFRRSDRAAAREASGGRSGRPAHAPCSAPRPMKVSPRRCFRSKRNGRRRSSSGCSSIRSTGSSRSGPRPEHDALRCAARPIASTCCRTARSASSTTS